MIRRPPRSTQSRSSAASDVYKRQELEGSVTGRFGKRDGSYLASASTMSVEFVPVANLRTEFTGAVATYDIAGVTGFADQHYSCLLYTSDAADDLLCVDLGGRRI